MVTGIAKTNIEKIEQVLEFYSQYKRASQGLPLKPKSFDGMIDVNDIKERTRVDNADINAHTYMRMLAQYGGSEWKIMEDIAEMRDHYKISEDGKQRIEWVEMTKAKNTMNIVTGIDQQTQPQDKRSRFAKLFRRGEPQNEQT